MAYGTDSDFNAWLSQFGYALPVGAPSPTVLRTRGSAYLDATYEPLWSGIRTDPLNQSDAWPRTGATLFCTTSIPDNVTPIAIVTASYRAAYLEALTPGILSGSPSSGPRVKWQKVDVIEREFFDDGAATIGNAGGFIDPSIDGAMKQFICDFGSSGFFFQSIGS